MQQRQALPMQPLNHRQEYWTAKPNQLISCPPGLEYLASLDQYFVHQQFQLFDTRLKPGFEPRKMFAVKTSSEQQCYYAFEESDPYDKYLREKIRGFVMHVVDNQGREVLRARRDFRGCIGWCCCIGGETCAFILNVELADGTHIGRIIQLHSRWTPKLAIQNSHNETELLIKGPWIACGGLCCREDACFQVFTPDGQQRIGNMTRLPPVGIDILTGASNFEISIPMDLDVKIKALLLCASFLVHVMYIDKNQ